MKKTIKTTLALIGIIVGILAFSLSGKAFAADPIEGFHAGSGTAEDPYRIATVEEFEILRGHLAVDDGYDHTAFTEVYFVLDDDIVYDKGASLTAPALGLAKCVIDGKGHSVSNVTSTGNPLFFQVNDTEIKNIVFKNCDLKNTPLIAKEMFDSKLTDITLESSKIAFTIKTKEDFAASSNFGSELRYGGLVNWAYDSVFENVNADATMTIKGTGNFGMICGNFQGEVNNCTASGKIKAAITYEKANTCSVIGGLFGSTYGPVKNCVNKAAITVSVPNKDIYCNVAGISGVGDYIADEPIIDKYYACKNKGNITVSSKWHKDTRQSVYVAGIEAGYAQCNIANCTNSGKIVTNDIDCVAGIVTNAVGTVKNCKNSGTFESTDTKSAAGIVNTAYGKVTNCKNTGKIKTTETFVHDYNGCNVAGIANSISVLYGNASVANCTNSGKLTTGGKGGLCAAAGIVNFMGLSDKYISTVSKCKNTGAITGEWWVSGIASMSGNWEVKNQKNVIKSCENTGTITGVSKDDYKQGILGYNNLNTTTVKNCTNKGKLK